jgi:hypothetical protein
LRCREIRPSFKVEKLGEAGTQSVAWLEFADAHRKRAGPNRLKGDALIGRDGSDDLNGTAFGACFAQCVEIANGALRQKPVRKLFLHDIGSVIRLDFGLGSVGGDGLHEGLGTFSQVLVVHP